MKPADKEWWFIIFAAVIVSLMCLAAVGYMTGKWDELCAGYAIRCAEQ